MEKPFGIKDQYTLFYKQLNASRLLKALNGKNSNFYFFLMVIIVLGLGLISLSMFNIYYIAILILPLILILDYATGSNLPFKFKSFFVYLSFFLCVGSLFSVHNFMDIIGDNIIPGYYSYPEVEYLKNGKELETGKILYEGKGYFSRYLIAFIYILLYLFTPIPFYLTWRFAQPLKKTN